MGCATCLCKSAIGILNTLIMLVGLAVAIVGIILQQAAGSTLLKFFEDSIKTLLQSIQILDGSSLTETIQFQALFQPASIILIVVGLFLACIGFLGCCGASCNYRIILILYTIVIGVLLLGQIIIVALFFTKALDDAMRKQAKKTLTEDYVDMYDSSPASVIWNVIMLRFACCGLDNYHDFDDAQKWERNQTLKIGGISQMFTLATPEACCRTSGAFPSINVIDEWCPVYPNDTTSNANISCWTSVTTELEPHRNIAIIVISIILVVQAAVLLLTILILKDDESKVCPV